MKILNNTTQDVEVYGELKQNRVSIDVKNIDFITQILSTNLYSRPLNSFLRETISNAIDSHKEAGTKDPIILDFGRNNGKWYIRIQDFGTGISPERFDAIYRFIGSSTKRDSNEYIGAFGVGRMSVLAVSDSATITNRYNGTEYKYLLYKDGMAVNIDEISISATKERNGLEVYCQPTIDLNYNSLTEAVKELAFFDGLYINNGLKETETYETSYGYRYNYSYQRWREFNEYVEKFNKRKIINFKTFSCVTIDCASEQCVLLGNVLYRIDYSHRDSNDYIYKSPTRYGEYIIFPRFNIGEISVTPNREDILYNNTSEALIKKKYNDVKNELEEIASQNVAKNLKTDIIPFICEDDINLVLNKDYNISVNIKFDIISKIIAEKSTVYGKKLNVDQIKNLGTCVSDITPFYSSHYKKGDHISTKDFGVSLSDINDKKLKYKDTNFYRCGFKTFNYYLKQYVLENYNKFTILKQKDERDVKRNILTYYTIVDCDKLTLAIYKKLCIDMWNSLPEISDSLVTDEFKSRYSRKNTYITENINVSYYSDGHFVQQQKHKVERLLNESDTYIMFTKAENVLPIELSSIPEWLIRKDDDFESGVKFIEVGEKTKKELFGKDGFIDWNKLIDHKRYWMRFIKTFEIIKKKDWYNPDIYHNCMYVHNPTKEMKAFIDALRTYCSTYIAVAKLKKYITPFWDSIEPIDDILEAMNPSEDMLNCIKFWASMNGTNDWYILSLLCASLPNINCPDKIKEEYNKLVELYSNKDDKEHNQNKQVSECNAQ